jgi:hypothetical protein
MLQELLWNLQGAQPFLFSYFVKLETLIKTENIEHNRIEKNTIKTQSEAWHISYNCVTPDSLVIKTVHIISFGGEVVSKSTTHLYMTRREKIALDSIVRPRQVVTKLMSQDHSQNANDSPSKIDDFSAGIHA